MANLKDLLVNGVTRFIGKVYAPTPETGDNSTQVATTAFVMEKFNGKVDLNFNNMNPSQTAKNTIAGWGLPDYSAGVDYANDTTINTAPSNGVLVISYYVAAITTSYFKINGENVAVSTRNSVYGIRATGQYMLSEGDTFQITSVATNNTTDPFIYRFYPCKGAN